MKKIFFIFCILFLIYGLISICGHIVNNLFAEDKNVLSEVEIINKYFAEEVIKNEMLYNAMWKYTENMSDKEYRETFYE